MKIRLTILFCLCAWSANAFVSGLDPDAAAWIKQCRTLSKDAGSLNNVIVNRTALSFKRNALWDLFPIINLRLGDDTTNASVRLKYPAGNSAVETIVGYVSSDYSPTGGVQGAESKYFAMPEGPKTVGVTSNSYSLWQSVLSSSAMGTTRIQVGALDGNNYANNIGTLNSGSQLTGVVGVNSVVMYPPGSATFITGLLCVNVASDPMTVNQTRAYTVNAPGVPAAGVLQGIAVDDGFGYLFYNTRIVRYLLSDFSTVLTNDTPFAGTTTNLTHLGDGCIYNSKLIVSGEAFVSGAVCSNACTLVYNTNTLALEALHPIDPSITIDAGGCVVGRGTLWVIAGAQTQHTNLFKFDPDTFAYQGLLTMDASIPTIQGIEYNAAIDRLVISEGGSGAPYSGFYSVNPTNGHVEQMMYSTAYSEMEGLAFSGTNLLCVANISPNFKIDAYAYTNTSNPLLRSQSFYADNSKQQVNLPRLATAGYAGVVFYVGGINNNGTGASFITNRFGATLVGKGLTLEQIGKASALVIQSEMAAGRRPNNIPYFLP